MNFAALDELEQFLTANPEIKVLELLMPDLSGILRAKRIHFSEFERLFNGAFLTPRSAPLLGTKGDWYDEIPLAEMGGILIRSFALWRARSRWCPGTIRR